MNPKTRLLIYIALAFILVASIAPAQIAQTGKTGAPSDLDAYAARVLKEFEVPGLAVAIVKDGKVVLAKGYGVRKYGEPAPVDENTLFGIASNTKAFTFVTFSLKPDGDIEQMKMAAVSPLTDFSFDFQDLLFTPAAPERKP